MTAEGLTYCMPPKNREGLCAAAFDMHSDLGTVLLQECFTFTGEALSG